MLIFATYDDFFAALHDGRCTRADRISVVSFYREKKSRYLYALPQLGLTTFATWRAGDVLDCLTMDGIR